MCSETVFIPFHECWIFFVCLCVCLKKQNKTTCNPSARASKLCTNNSGTAHCNNIKRYLVIKEDSTQRRHFVISFHSKGGSTNSGSDAYPSSTRGQHKWGDAYPCPSKVPIGCEVTACRAHFPNSLVISHSPKRREWGGGGGGGKLRCDSLLCFTHSG